jgi:hypothetical protein
MIFPQYVQLMLSFRCLLLQGRRSGQHPDTGPEIDMDMIMRGLSDLFGDFSAEKRSHTAHKRGVRIVFPLSTLSRRTHTPGSAHEMKKRKKSLCGTSYRTCSLLPSRNSRSSLRRRRLLIYRLAFPSAYKLSLRFTWNCCTGRRITVP